MNRFGLFREYHAFPECIPESALSSAEMATSAALEDSGMQEQPSDMADQEINGPSVDNFNTLNDSTPLLGPCQTTSELLMNLWFWNMGSRKTQQDRKALVDMMLSPHFSVADLANTNWRALDEALSHPLDTKANPSDEWEHLEAEYKAGGWIERDISIGIPFKDRLTRDPNSISAQNLLLPQDNLFTVPGVHIRSIPHLIRSIAATESKRRKWEWTAYSQRWQHSEDGKTREQRVYGEVVCSDSYIEAYNEVQRKPSPSGCKLPKTVVPIHVWSDSTHLGDFTNASLHPVYIGFGNESKYARSKPKLRSCHQVAFFPKVCCNCQSPYFINCLVLD